MEEQVWRVLHIDDDEDDYILVRSMLNEAQGRSVSLDWAATLKAGRSKLEANTYQAVLIDYDLGVETGIDLIREFVDRDYAAPLILLTGRGSYEVDVEAMRSGATLYLTKNEINPLLLERSIRYAIERKQAETDLRERDRKLSVALNAAQLGTWTYNYQDDTFVMDERSQQMYRADEAVSHFGDIIQNYFHPDDRLSTRAALVQAADPLRDGRYQIEFRILQRDGSVRWLSAWGLVEFEGSIQQRHAARLIGASRDITWGKQAEITLEASNQAVRESEQSVKEIADRFKAVLENSLDVAYRRDLQRDCYDYMSPVVEQVLGFTVDEMLNMTIQEVFERIHPEDLPILEGGLVQAAKEGRSKLEYRFKCKNGQYRWLADYATITKDSEGKLLYRTGILRDVTDQVRSEQALRISEERFQLASQAVTGILYDWTIGRKELYQSEGLKKIVGYKPGEEPGGTTDWWPRNIHPDDYPYVQTELQNAINGLCDSFSYEYRIRHRDGHWVHIWDQGYIVRDDHGQALRVVGTCTDISGRVHSEKALRESEKDNRQQKDLLEAVLQALPVGVWITNEDGKIIGKNAQVDRMWGGNAPLADSIEQYQVYEVWDLKSGKRLSSEEYPLSVVLRTGQTVEPMEIRVRRFDGTEGMHLVSAAPIKDSAGRLTGSVAITVDISEHKQSEEALRVSEQKYRDLAEALEIERAKLATAIENLPVGVGIGDGSGNTLSLNAAGLAIHGFESEEAMFSQLDRFVEDFELCYLDGRVMPLEDWPASRAMRGEFVKGYELRLRNKNKGFERILAYDAVPVENHAGETALILYVMQDLTERKRAELTLQASESRFRQLADAMPQLVWTSAPDGRIDYVNQSHHFYNGISHQDDHQWDWEPVLHPLDSEPTIKGWKDSVDTGLRFQIEHRFRMADGNYHWHLTRGTPVFDDRGKLAKWYGTTTDIHDFKTAQVNLSAYADQLKRSNEELENFAFVASHDLQEPLRKILMFGKSLRRKLEGQMPNEAEDHLSRIENAAERMQAMIEGLLDLARVNTHGGHFALVDLKQTTEEVILDLAASIQETGGQVIVEQLPPVEGDVLQLRRLFQNLIGNALKYHKEGTAPIIRITSVLNESNQPQTVSVIIEDNGTGFDESIGEKLFQPFVRLHNRSSYKGSGIGLAICRKIIERHGGSISASSRPGEGSRFTVVLPVRAQKCEPIMEESGETAE